MKKLYFLLAQIFVTGIVAAQQSPNRYADLISADSLKRHLYVIASDEYEGRETGEPGQKMAAEYIRRHFERYNIAPGNDTSYLQPFNVVESGIEDAAMTVNGVELNFIDDFYFYGALVAAGEQTMQDVHFMGYGIDDSLYSDYRNTGLSPVNAVIFDGEPTNRAGNFLLTGTGLNTDWSKDFSMKLEAAKRYGVKNLFIIKEDYEDNIRRMAFYLKMPRVSLSKENASEPELSVFFISQQTAKQMLGKKFKPVKLAKIISYKGESKPFVNSIDGSISVIKTEELKITENVLGLIKGETDEILVITAHYDHLGKRGDDIYNGADDDGSGTVGLLELARVFAAARDSGDVPKRSILFMAVSGEEKGLLGSDFYTRNPVYPLENTVANLNIDMIGRNDDKYAEGDEYIYLIGSDRLSTTLHAISETTNERCCGLTLDYTYNSPDDPNRFYYRSDHYNFAKNNIPVIFYFSGVHEDYHKPTDTPDKIQYPKMRTVVSLIFHTAWEVANTNRAIEVDVVETE
jgi:hypothetical protein